MRNILVRHGKIDCDLEVPLGIMKVSERTARRVLGLLPNLAHHICINEKGETFGDEIVGTELAHLLEHVVVELQGQAHGNTAPGFFKGHTSWLAELAETRPRGFALMRVTVTFANDLVALQAVSDACEILSWAVAPRSEEPKAPDIAVMIAGLRRMM